MPTRMARHRLALSLKHIYIWIDSRSAPSRSIGVFFPRRSRHLHGEERIMVETLRPHESLPGEQPASFLNPVVVAIVALIALLLIAAAH